MLCISVAYAIVRCLYVAFVYSVQTSKCVLKLFFNYLVDPTVLVFL